MGENNSAQPGCFQTVAFTTPSVARGSLLPGPLAWTQTVDSGRISGVVEDGSGAVVAAAIVTVQDQATGWSEKLLSDSKGLFVTPPLGAADYDVTVEALGFARVIEHVRLEVAQRAALESKLRPGDAKQSITVEASVTQLATETSTLSNVRTETAVQNLPMNGRNFAELMGLTAGVVPAQQRRTASPITKATSGMRNCFGPSSSQVSKEASSLQMAQLCARKTPWQLPIKTFNRAPPAQSAPDRLNQTITMGGSTLSPC